MSPPLPGLGLTGSVPVPSDPSGTPAPDRRLLAPRLRLRALSENLDGGSSVAIFMGPGDLGHEVVAPPPPSPVPPPRLPPVPETLWGREKGRGIGVARVL